MKKINSIVKRSSTIVLASAMILNSSGVMTFAQTLELEKKIAAIEESYGINSSKNNISTDSLGELKQEVQAVTDEQQLERGTIAEESDIVTTNADTSIGDGLRTLLDNGTALTGNVEEDKYKINVTKGQNIGFYSDSASQYDINFVGGENNEFEYADYDAVCNNSFGLVASNISTQEGHYVIITILEDGVISIPSVSKDSIEVKSVTSPALKHNTVESRKNYELKLTDEWNNSVSFKENVRYTFVEYSIYDTNDIVQDWNFGSGLSGIEELNRQENKVREVITSTSDENVDVTYPYEYAEKAVTFTEINSPALKHQTIESGKSYKVQLKEGQTINPKFILNDCYYMEHAIYGKNGYCYDYTDYQTKISFSASPYYEINAEYENMLILTSEYEEDSVAIYPYEYDMSVMTFEEVDTPALRHETLEAGKSYELKVSKDYIEHFDFSSKGNIEFAEYDNEQFYSWGIGDWTNFRFHGDKLVITCISEENGEILIPYQYYNKAVTFNEREKSIFQKITFSANKNYKITNNGKYRVQNIDNDDDAFIDCTYGDNQVKFQSTITPGIGGLAEDENSNNFVYISTYDEDKTIRVPTEYADNLKIEEVDEPIFNRIELKPGENLKLTSKSGVFSTKVNVRGDDTSKISTLVMKPNQNGELSSDIDLSDLDLYGNQDLYIQASSDNVNNVLVGVLYKDSKEENITVEKTDMDISQVNEFEDIMNVAVKETKAAKPNEEQVTDSKLLSDYEYTMYNETTKQFINGYQYSDTGELTFSNGSVNDGDVIRITISSDSVDEITQTFTYNKNGNVELNVIQKGGYSITDTSDLYMNVYLLDSEGNIVKSDITQNDINEECITSGQYKLLVIKTNEQYVNSLTSFNDLELYGLEQDKDYTLTDCEIKSGVINTFDISEYISVSKEKTLTSFDKEKTKVTASSDILIKDNKATITVDYTIASGFDDLRLNGMNIAMPSNVKVVENSVKIDGTNVGYSEQQEKLVIYVNNISGKVTFDIEIPNDLEKTFTFIASAELLSKDSIVTNTIGEVSINYYNFNFSIGKDFISRNQLILDGSSNELEQDIAIFLDGEQVKTVKANKYGHWNTHITIPGKELGEVYNIYASLYTGTDNEIKTDEQQVIYNPISSIVKKFDLTYNSQSYDVIDYNNKDLKLDLVSGDKYKFTLGFGDASVKDVYVLGIKDGVQKKIKATQDDNGDWIAEGYFDNDKTFVPDLYNVTFTEEEQKFEVTASASASTVKSGDTVTINTELKNSKGEYTYKFIVYDTDTKLFTELQSFTSSSSYTWKTTTADAGNKQIYVYVKDSEGNITKSNAVDVKVEKVEEVVKPLTINATKQEDDKTVTFTATGNGGSGKYSYKFIVYNKTTNSWAKLQDFSEKNTFTWTKGNAGDRYFYVDVKDNNTGEVVRSEALNVKLEETTKPLAISATKQESDNTVTFTAEGSGGSGKYSYKFIVYNKTTNSWAKLQDFSDKNTFTWAKGNAGDRYFYVDVKDNTTGKTVRSEALNVKIEETTKPLAISATKKEADKTVTFTAEGNGGSGKYSYKFIVYNKTTNSWAKLQDFSSKNTFTWTKGNAGDRYFYVDVKDNTTGKTVRSEALNVKIDATNSPTSTLTASTSNVNVGGKVTLTAKATAGSGKYTYKFLIYNPATKQWAKLQDFSDKSTFTWTAGSAGARQFYVDVKDSNGKVTRSQVVNVQVGNAQSVTKLSVKATASTTANKVGQNVTFTATGNGGAGGYTYKFLVYNKTTKQWAKLQDFSATSKLTWKAGSAGERQFYVDVKDKNGNTVRSSVMNVNTTK